MVGRLEGKVAFITGAGSVGPGTRRCESICY